MTQVDSIDIACAAVGPGGGVRRVGTVAGDCASLVKALRRLSAPERYEQAATIVTS